MNQVKRLTASVLLACAYVGAAEPTFSTDTQTTLGTDTYTISGTQETTGLRVESSSGAILQGTDESNATLSFTAAGTMSLAGALDMRNLTLTGLAGLSVVTDAYDTITKDQWFHVFEELIFPDKDLDDWDIVVVKFGGKAATNATGYPYHVKRYTDTSGQACMEAQMQDVFGSGDYLRGVKIRLIQKADGIYSQLVYARYLHESYTVLEEGYDFDFPPYSTYAMTADPNAYGYGVQSITLEKRRTCERVWKFAGDWQLPGALTIGYGAKVIFDTTATLPGGEAPCFTNDLTLVRKAQITFDNKSLTLRGTVTGDGTIVFSGETNKAACTTTTAASISSSGLKDSSQKIASNIMIHDIMGISDADLYQNSDTRGLANPTTGDDYIVCFFTKTESEITFQVQVRNDVWVKCAIIKLYNDGTDLKAIRTLSPYQSDKIATAGEYDFRTQPRAGTLDYNVRHLNIIHYQPSVVVSLACTNTMCKAHYDSISCVGLGTIIATNCITVNVNDNKALPPYGTLHAYEGSVVNLNTGSNAGQNGGKVTIHAHSGASIRVYKGNAIGRDLSISKYGLVLDGAECLTLVEPYYANHVTFMNGASFKGQSPWLCYNQDARWRVKGTTPSTCDVGLRLASPSYKTFYWNVEDVTQDAGVDMTLNGSMQNYDSSYHYRTYVAKEGAGTILINGATSYTNKTTIYNGTWLLGKSKIMNAKQDIVLAGGTLSACANCSNELRKVTLTKNSTIALNEGTVFVFKDSSDYAWTSGTRLNITGAFDRHAIRFGTSANGLTAKQKSALRVNGTAATLSAEGYVARCGLRIILR